jgi:lysophospholipase L1-like esterase
VENLRHMVGTVESLDSLPVVATIIPANPNGTAAAERNEWLRRINERIRTMAREEGAALADLHAAFLREPDLAALFADHVHPNDRGYRVIADEYFRTLTRPLNATTSASLPWTRRP